MNQNTLKDKYNTIWSKYQSLEFPGKEILERGYAFHFDEDEQGSDILFIGINPSFAAGSEYGKFVFDRNNTYSYFRPFQYIADTLNKEYQKEVKWTHLDLLVFRETNQDYIGSTFFKSEIGLKFIMEQIEMAKERIEHIKPKVIVVSNALARVLMGKEMNVEGTQMVWMGHRFKFSKDLGTDVIVSNNTLVFFTSMLSGQRALDNGSKERLIWHIAQVL